MAGIGIGIGIGNPDFPGIGIGIGIEDLSFQVLELVLVLTFSIWSGIVQPAFRSWLKNLPKRPISGVNLAKKL